MALLQLKSVTVSFGGPPLLNGVDLTIERGERLCLLGRNGCGKSTLLQVIQGTLEADGGRRIKDSGTRIAMLDQRVPAGLEGRVEDIVVAGLGCVPQRQTEPHRARAAISRAGLDPDADVSNLSAGLKRRVLIASAIASDADLLLLDEPTNHLDLESIAWLEGLFTRQEKTLLFVTHDRAFLRRLATGILDLDRGRLQRHDADYDTYLARKQGALDSEARGAALFDKRLAQEEVWIRQGVRERRKRNQGRVGRLMEMRDAFSERRGTTGTARMTAQSATPTGRLVVEAKGLTYTWGDDLMPVIDDLTTTIMRGERIGILGSNGSGKTTLIRLLLGELEPQEGTVRQGTNLQIAYFDQLHATLDDSLTAAENVGEGSSTVTVNGKVRQIIGYLADFLFTADQARAPITKLSGGERNRLLLARLFARPSNLLILDEPTNDLDVQTLEVLEDLLAAYEGTVLVVSHDRELLDHVVTSTLVMEGYGRVRSFAGGYTDWVSQRKAKAKSKSKSKSKTSGNTAAAKKKSAPATSRLDSRERKDLRELPAQLEKLEARQVVLHKRLAEPDFFKQSRAEIARVEGALERLDEAIALAYSRWEALEAKQGGSA